MRVRRRDGRPGSPEGGGSGRGACGQGIGRSRSGLTGKIVAVTDAPGFLARFVILPGQPHGPVGVPDLLEGLRFGAPVGDRASGADWLLGEVAGRRAEAVIPSKANRKEPREHDREMYRLRHRMDSFFAETKEFRSVATRHYRTAGSFAAAVHLVSGVIAAK